MRDAPPSLLAQDTYLLSRVGKAARGRVAERLADRGLRLWHVAILAALDDFGPHSQRQLASRLSIDPSDVTKALDDLTATGHVTRTREPSDRRRITVDLTPSGRTLLKELHAEAEAVQEDLLAPLDPRERAHLSAALRKIAAALP
jgi:DNA-binding MarR family transcriptional regulator